MNTTVVESTLSILTTTTTKQPRTFEVEEEEPLAVSIGIFLGILFGALLFIFLMIGLMILGHSLYMKVFKKPWSEAKSKTIWFIEPQIKEEKKSNINHEKLSEIDSYSRRSSISIDSAIRADPNSRPIAELGATKSNDINHHYPSNNLANSENAQGVSSNTGKKYPSSYLRITEV
jgi:hypothetical protein